MRKNLSFFLWIFFLFLIIRPCYASQAGIVKKGNQKYKEGDYVSALESYKKALDKNPDSDIINFNAGTACYQNGDYSQAADYLQKTLLTDDARLQQQAAYNLGDAFYQQGKVKEKQDINFAVLSLEKSLASFQKAIDLDQEDKDAQHNYEFVKKELEKLKQQQQQNTSCPLPKKENLPKDSQDKNQSQKQQQQNQKQQNQQAQDQQKRQSQSQEEKDSQEQSSQSEQEKQSEETLQNKTSSSSNGKLEKSTEEKSQALSQEERASMTQQQAEAALGNYQQSEEPKGFLYLLKRPPQDNAIEKDW